MPTASVRVLRITVRGGAILLGAAMLAGCAGQGATDGTASNGTVPSDAEQSSAPNPTIGLDCDSVIELDTVQAALGAVELREDPVRIPGGSWPLNFVGLAQAGALDCYWGDDAAPQREYPRYLAVVVRTDASGMWNSWEQELSSWSQPTSGHGDAAYADCSGQPDYLYCEYDVLIGNAWVHAEVKNLDAHDDAAPIIRSLVDAVSEAEPAEQAWQSPAVRLPASCAELLTADAIMTAVGFDGIAEREYPLSMPIVLNEALAGGLECSWSNSYSSEQAMPVGVAIQPGAGWAWEALWAKPRPERSPAEPLAGIGQHAFAGCSAEPNNVCFVDVLLPEGTWVAVDGNKQAGVDGLKAVAAAAIAGIGG